MLSQAFFFYGSENKASQLVDRVSLTACFGFGVVVQWCDLPWNECISLPSPASPKTVVFLLPNPSLSCIHRICSLIWELDQRHCRFHNLTTANILILYISWLDFIKKFRSVVSDSEIPWTTESTEFSRPEYWRDLLNPGIEPRCPALLVDSLPAKSQGKPKNTGMGSLSLLQQIFPTQDLNQGLLHWQAESLPIELSGKTSLAKAEKTRVSPFPSWWVSGVQQDSTWEVTLSESCRQDFSAVT